MSKRWRALVFLAVALATTGCLRKDYPVTGPVVSRVELEGATVVDRDEVLGGLATAESPRFLGIWDGVVFDYEVFDEALLERDLERVTRYYRARGYYEAQVSAARVVRQGDHHVRVEIRVHEGQPVRVGGSVTTPGVERLPFDAAVAAQRALRMKPGDVFDEDAFQRTEKSIEAALADRGFAFAKVKGTARVDVANHEAAVSYAVDAGPPAVYGDVAIVGLKDIPEGPVRDNLAIAKGKPYSRAELGDARTAIVDLGVFATVDVRQDLSHPEKGVVPITVTVQEAPLRTLRVGGGMRFDVLEWSSNLTFGWEHQNFLGGMRRFSIEARPGAVFYPTRMDNLAEPTNVLLRNRVRAELRQPSLFEGRTTGFVAGEFNVYPVLYPGLGASGERENVIGYVEVKAQVGARRPFFGHHLYVTPSYNWQANAPFAYIGENTLDTARVSYPELNLVLDFRDDPIDPHSGVFVAGTAQAAGGIFGGDATDVKVQPELRTYVPISRSVTFATRATVGFLFPDNYGGTLRNPGAIDIDRERLRDQQLLLFRAFYSGGPTSNRGYPFRGVGPQGLLGFLLPSAAACVRSSDPVCYRPLGGLSLWEASAEVRFPLIGPLRGALFVDASDVARDVAVIRFRYPHVSPGFGLRYATPVGPVRLDVGYRLPFAQRIGSRGLPPEEGSQTDVLGLPVAVHFGLGEAF